MAEAIAYNIATEILKKLGSSLFQEIKLVQGLKGELRKLENTVSTIRAVLLDAEEQQGMNYEVKYWLDKLKDAFDDAENLLDDFSTEVLRCKLMAQSPNRRARKVRAFFSSSNTLAFSVKMARHVKKVRENLDAIAVDKAKFHFTERPLEGRVQVNRDRETHSYVYAEEIVGRIDDKMAIIELLLESDVGENVSIVPIVGIGGLGKTTLAQLVFNDDKVKKHFECRLWVCVSEVFDVKLIAEKIIESATGTKSESLQMDRVQYLLRKEIEGRKYLLVLDDVWNEDPESWLKLRELLMGGAKGSKILLTTRSHVVAMVTGTIPPYLLGDLSEEEAWTLFKRMAFVQEQDAENSRILTIAMDIVKKCARVPLAIKSLGSLLRYKDTEDQWLYFKNNDLPKIAEKNNVILPTLKLSYDYLPSYLKHCFAYCSLYPKDHEINKEALIKMWIALGCIQSSEENQNLEDEGDLYFMDLLGRSFFQEVKADEWGNIISCKMHDLIHDLAQSVAGTECSLAKTDARNVTERTRHVSFDSSGFDISSWDFPPPLQKATKVRTFLLLADDFQDRELRESTCYQIISSFRRLRVLDLHNLGIIMVPACVSKLKHLRYLDLSKNPGLASLPNSLTKLQNLQTLKLSYCCDLKELPEDFWKLINLRHLELDGCTRLTHMPWGLGQLTSLHTLNRFIVSKDSMGRHTARLSEIGGLNNLRGALCIEGLGKQTVTEVVKEANYLKEKEYLWSLALEWDYGHTRCNDNVANELLLQSLQPHPNLKELRIQGYRGLHFAGWMMFDICFSLPHLVKITIICCDKCKHLPPLGQLPFLQCLILENLRSVEYMDDSLPCSFTEKAAKETFFPSLKELHLENMPKLKGWWRGYDIAAGAALSPGAATGEQREKILSPEMLSFSCLSELAIIDCPKLMSMPLCSCVQDLFLYNVSEKLLHKLLMTRTAPVVPKLVASPSTFIPLSNLISICIDEIEDLVSLSDDGLQNLTSLQSLKISNCSRLCSLSGGLRHLKSLEILEIRDCNELDLSQDDDGLQFEGLQSLTSLFIGNISMLASLPVGLQHVTTLQLLRIEQCENLVTLPDWIGNLTSLQQLRIEECPKLVSLPEAIHGILALQELRIWHCPQLQRNCKKGTGGDWPKISHIPTISTTQYLLYY